MNSTEWSNELSQIEEMPLTEDEIVPEKADSPEESDPLFEASGPSEEEPVEESSEEILEEPSSEEEVATLKAEIDRLRALLEQKEREQKRVMEEMDEFSRLFPNTSVRQIPDEVWQNVDAGIPLSAAYALYEKKSRIDRLHAQEINRQNAERSAGSAGVHTPNEYFSPEEVRAMSPSEVRENFKKIRESMKKWRH